jgi:hypothetical protein
MIRPATATHRQFYLVHVHYLLKRREAFVIAVAKAGPEQLVMVRRTRPLLSDSIHSLIAPQIVRSNPSSPEI